MKCGERAIFANTFSALRKSRCRKPAISSTPRLGERIMRWSSPHGGQLITVGAKTMRTGKPVRRGRGSSALGLRTTDYGLQLAEPSASPALHRRADRQHISRRCNAVEFSACPLAQTFAFVRDLSYVPSLGLNVFSSMNDRMPSLGPSSSCGLAASCTKKHDLSTAPAAASRLARGLTCAQGWRAGVAEIVNAADQPDGGRGNSRADLR